jgi:hypothetical protein
MPGMLMSERRTIKAGSIPPLSLLSACSPEFAKKALAEQFGDLGLIVNNEDADAHAALPLAVLCFGRGSRTVNSV